ncbi:MAG: hypothetical protein WCX97_04255 [Candidatus Magasanikbacteria bacterium]
MSKKKKPTETLIDILRRLANIVADLDKTNVTMEGNMIFSFGDACQLEVGVTHESLAIMKMTVINKGEFPKWKGEIFDVALRIGVDYEKLTDKFLVEEFYKYHKDWDEGMMAERCKENLGYSKTTLHLRKILENWDKK